MASPMPARSIYNLRTKTNFCILTYIFKIVPSSSLIEIVLSVFYPSASPPSRSLSAIWVAVNTRRSHQSLVRLDPNGRLGHLKKICTCNGTHSQCLYYCQKYSISITEIASLLYISNNRFPNPHLSFTVLTLAFLKPFPRSSFTIVSLSTLQMNKECCQLRPNLHQSPNLLILSNAGISLLC